MLQTFTTPQFNAYMLQRRNDYLTECKKDHELTDEDVKLAKFYFPQVYNNRGQLLKSGYIHYCEYTGNYSWTKKKCA